MWNTSKRLPQISRTILLLNGLGDVLIGLCMLFAVEQFASLLNFHYTPEVQYLAGGWGIATLTLGVWRFLASRSVNQEFVAYTVFFGLFEGGLLSVLEVSQLVFGRLSVQQTSLGLGFSSLFALAYLFCIVNSR